MNYGPEGEGDEYEFSESKNERSNSFSMGMGSRRRNSKNASISPRPVPGVIKLAVRAVCNVALCTGSSAMRPLFVLVLCRQGTHKQDSAMGTLFKKLGGGKKGSKTPAPESPRRDTHDHSLGRSIQRSNSEVSMQVTDQALNTAACCLFAHLACRMCTYHAYIPAHK